MLRLLRSIFFASVALHLSGCALFYRYEAISEQPTRDASDVPLQPRLSTIQPALTVPLSSLQDAANKATEKVLPFSDTDRKRVASLEIMKPWPLSGCWVCEYLDVDWHFTVSQPSPITVAGRNNQLVIGLPAALSGGAGFNGEIAKWLSLSNKRFGAALEINFESGLVADANFCPTLTDASLKYRWITDPYVQLVGRSCVFEYCFGPWNLEFDGPIDASVRPQLQRVASDLQQNIPCKPIRDSLAKVWRGYSSPVKVPYEQLYLNILPQALYFPGLSVTSTDVVFSGRLDANVSLDPTAVSVEPTPLPSNTLLPISPGRFSLAVPISTQYYTFSALAKQELDKQKFRASTSLGDILVTPAKVELYPTADGQQVALGVSVAVEFQYLFFLNSSGTVWMTAKPEAVDGGRRVRLSDIKVTRKFSNPIWNVASVLLEDKVAGALRDGFELDLNEPLSKAEADITATLSNAGQGSGVTLSARDVKISVGRMLANEKSFQLEAIFDAMVEARLGEISMQ